MINILPYEQQIYEQFTFTCEFFPDIQALCFLLMIFILYFNI